MKKNQMGSYRKILLDHKETLLAKVKNSVTLSREDASDEVRDAADMASDYYERELAMGLSETERARLLEVEDALERIESGDYGKCEVCGNEISAPRLEALPFTKFCIDCQSHRETNKKNIVE